MLKSINGASERKVNFKSGWRIKKNILELRNFFLSSLAKLLVISWNFKFIFAADGNESQMYNFITFSPSIWRFGLTELKVFIGNFFALTFYFSFVAPTNKDNFMRKSACNTFSDDAKEIEEFWTLSFEMR